MSLRTRYRQRRARKVLRRAWAHSPNSYDFKVLFATTMTNAFSKGAAQLAAEEDYEFDKLYRELGALTEVRPTRRYDGVMIYVKDEA